MNLDDLDFDKLFLVTAEEVAGIYDRAVKAFNEACDKMEREDTDAKVRQLLGDTLGHRTYMITVERG